MTSDFPGQYCVAYREPPNTLRTSYENYQKCQKEKYAKSIKRLRESENKIQSSEELTNKIRVVFEKFHQYCETNRHLISKPLQIFTMPFPTRLEVIDADGKILYKFPEEKQCPECDISHPDVWYKFDNRNYNWILSGHEVHSILYRGDEYWELPNKEDLDAAGTMISDVFRTLCAIEEFNKNFKKSMH